MFRLKVTTLQAVGCFILCWIFFTVVLLEIFDQDVVDRLFQAKVPETSDSSAAEFNSHMPAPSADVVAAVLEKYAKNSQDFTLFLGDVTPEDRKILELVFYPHLHVRWSSRPLHGRPSAEDSGLCLDVCIRRDNVLIWVT